MYVFIWQLMFITDKWELEELLISSLTLYRGWLCLLMSCNAWIFYDILFSYFPSHVHWVYFWMFSIRDIFQCLHPEGAYYSSKTIEDSPPVDTSDLTNDDTSRPAQYYITWNPNENILHVKGDNACLGLDDFFILNLMLLSIVPSLSSITVQICVFIGHVIAVQIGQEATYQLGRLFQQLDQPAAPLPAIMVSLYSIILKSFLSN
ncbi:hypothetical protein I4U23_004818 [Adineta vaga]|nr:hypothetical protein I4U23_004818 [Adineta vaga]